MKKAVNKPLQTDDKTVKRGKKTGKNIDKTMAISVVICLAVALAVVLFVTLAEPMIAALQLNRAERFIEKEPVSAVVVNSPLETEGILNGKEAVLRDGEARELAARISAVLENVKYSEIKSVNSGIWKTKIVLYNSTEELTLYADAEGVYLEKDGRLIRYEVKDESREEYEKLLSDLENLLKK